MLAPFLKETIQEVPVKLAGGTHYGRYPKISQEQTFNMIVSDGALVDYAGYKNVVNIAPVGQGRGLYSSSRANLMVAVIGNGLYKITSNLTVSFLITLSTSSGDTFIAENNGGEIAVTDGVNIYVFDYQTNVTTVVTGSSLSTLYGFNVSPGYISFQNGRFIIACLGTSNWILSDFNAITFSGKANSVGSLQSKPDTVQAAVPFPGRGNLLFLFGSTVVEAWTDQGQAIFPYVRQNSFNIDYGCLNASSIAALGDEVIWLGANEASGPVIMRSNGNGLEEISTDGLDFKFSELKNPTDCSGFLKKLDGHLIYQFTFKTDNLSYIYDFTTKLFFTVTDENLDYHVAHKVVFFDNVYYFASFNDGNLYEFGTNFTNYQYSPTAIKQIPRIRIMPPMRLPSARYYIIKSLEFTVENGEPNNITSDFFYAGPQMQIAGENGNIIGGENFIGIGSNQLALIGPTQYDLASEAIDLAISRDGGANWGNQLRRNMNPTGNRKSLFNYQRLGIANDSSIMLQMHGFGRFVLFDGVAEVYQ